MVWWGAQLSSGGGKPDQDVAAWREQSKGEEMVARQMEAVAETGKSRRWDWGEWIRRSIGEENRGAKCLASGKLHGDDAT